MLKSTHRRGYSRLKDLSWHYKLIEILNQRCKTGFKNYMMKKTTFLRREEAHGQLLTISTPIISFLDVLTLVSYAQLLTYPVYNRSHKHFTQLPWQPERNEYKQTCNNIKSLANCASTFHLFFAMTRTILISPKGAI